MDEQGLQALVRAEYNLRLRPAMSRYVLEKLQAGGADAVAVIGGDALTGRARRAELSVPRLVDLLSPNKSELS